MARRSWVDFVRVDMKVESVGYPKDVGEHAVNAIEMMSRFVSEVLVSQSVILIGQ